MSYQYDHRQLAEEMEIYFLNDKIGAGLPVWLPNGVAIRDSLESWMKRLERNEGYHRVVSPHLAKSDLYEQSGHLKCFGENMYPPIHWPEDQSKYYLKPMNCPHHHQAFAANPKSYRQLPYRIAEYAQVYRYENSGSLRGISRVRGLCQNDAHIYVDPEHAEAEMLRVLDLHEKCYAALGLKGYRYRLSLHDPNRPESFEGAKAQWIECEAILRKCLEQKGLPYFEGMGEAAFYGPKIDVQMMIGSAGNEESIASMQLDFNSGEKFDLHFMNQRGEKIRPWVIHRAPLGSHERFVSLLLEYYDGQLPGWLAPVQVFIVPAHENQQEDALKLQQSLLESGVRSQIDLGSGSLSKRIRMIHRYRPYSKIILGERELKSGELILERQNLKEFIRMRDLEAHLKALCQEP